MSIRTFALIFGILFIAAGAAGFVSGLTSPLHPEHPDVMGNGGQVFGLFPVNEVHNGVHLLFGLWGLAASRSLGAAVTYARGVAIIYAVLTVFGLVPALETLFGTAPLYGNDVWLHGLLALVGAYFGWAHRHPAVA